MSWIKRSAKITAVSEEQQQRFVASLEGIGDILVFEVKRANRNTFVLQQLQKLRETIAKLFSLRQTNPEKFEQLLFHKDYFKLYRENEKEAQLALAFATDKYLVSFSTGINQLIRVHRAALTSKNDEISINATYQIVSLLGDLVKFPGMDLLVEKMLKYLRDIAILAIEHQDRSVYSAAIGWYINIVFNSQSENCFDLSYLKLFDTHFFGVISYMITENQANLFHSLVRAIHDGIVVPTYDKGLIWKYGYIFQAEDFNKYEVFDEKHALAKRIRELAESEDDLDTVEKLEAWLKKFQELKDILKPQFTESQKQKADELEAKIRKAVKMFFLHSNLSELMFGVGAYCLFKGRPEFIRELWEYRQPRDSDVQWVGHELVPQTLDEVIKFYFKKSLFERGFLFWEDHHGTQIYQKKYFLLLLARCLDPMLMNGTNEIPFTQNYRLPEFHIDRLSNIEYSADDLITCAKEMMSDEVVEKTLRFAQDSLLNLFQSKVVPFLKALKEKAQDRINQILQDEPISQAKIEEFRNDLLNAFYSSAALRSILKEYGLYFEELGLDGKPEQFRIDIVSDKAAFFEEWHVRYLHRGGQFGKELGISENIQLWNDISTYCKEISVENFNRKLSEAEGKNNFLILSSFRAIRQFFMQSKNFRPKWDRQLLELKIVGFEGWYLAQTGDQIPVFAIDDKDDTTEIILLNKSRLGVFMQNNPATQAANANDLKDILFISIRAFSEHPELLKLYLENPPPWLQQIESKEERGRKLREKVFIEIWEKFQFCPHPAFEGYVVKNPLLLRGNT